MDFDVLITDQHTDLLVGTPADTDLAFARHLNLPSTGHISQWRRAAKARLEAELVNASLVVVQGDTMSAFAGAEAAVKLSKPVAHVEAGVRSGDLREPFPEEILRTRITQMARWHFAATSHAVENLRQEGVAYHNIFLTGNTVVSALARYTGQSPVKEPAKRVVVTLHRRETTRRRAWTDLLEALFWYIGEYPEWEFVWPTHPGVAFAAGFAPPENLTFEKALPYAKFVSLLAHSAGVLTDSGGVVEEAATLGVPSVQLRRVSDRPEAVKDGVSWRCSPTPEGVEAALVTLVTRELPRRPSNCFGYTDAAERVADLLVKIAGQDD